MDAEKKAALMKRLAEGRAKVKAAREDAKAKGMPDPKPRKPRAKKVKADLKHAEPVDPKEAIAEPMAAKPAREKIAPIDAAPAGAVNAVSAAPVDPEMTVTSKIDVPNLPDAAGRKKIEKDAAVIPEAKPRKGISTTGEPEKYNNNEMIRDMESGNQAIEAMYPGQKESVEKLLKKDKKEDKPLKPKPEPMPPTKTVKNVFRHVPDIKATEGRLPFSFAAIRRQLYQ
jgi:hypothetical protein